MNEQVPFSVQKVCTLILICNKIIDNPVSINPKSPELSIIAKLTAVIGASYPLSVVADNAPSHTIASGIGNAIEEDLSAALVDALNFPIDISIEKGKSVNRFR